MRSTKWLAALIAALAIGLIAAGCGGDDTTSSTAASDTSTSAGSTTESTTSSSGGASADDVYNACIDAIQGTPAEAAGQTACEQARSAFEQCASQAENAPEGSARDLAIQACQDAADQATQALQAAG